MDNNIDKTKNKTAVAISYEKEDNAPRIIATGVGTLADRIIDTAKEAEVPIHKDEHLAGALSNLEIGDAIPPELYDVVAEILVFVSDMDKLKEKISLD